MWGALKLQVLENASMVKQKYKKAKCVTVENTSTEKASTSEQGQSQYYSTYSVLYHLVGRLEFRSKG